MKPVAMVGPRAYRGQDGQASLIAALPRKPRVAALDMTETGEMASGTTPHERKQHSLPTIGSENCELTAR